MYITYTELQDSAFQSITPTRNCNTVYICPHVLKHGNPSGNINLQLLDENGYLIEESTAVPISSISASDYAHGYLRFAITTPLLSGVTYRIKVLGTGGYSYSAANHIGFCKSNFPREASFSSDPNFKNNLDYELEIWERDIMSRTVEFFDGFSTATVPSELQSQQYTLLNNQSTTNVTGLILNKNDYTTAVLECSVYRRTDSDETKAVVTAYAIYHPDAATWSLEYDSNFDLDTGVTLSITNSGQIQYSTTNLAGANYSGYLNVYSSGAWSEIGAGTNTNTIVSTTVEIADNQATPADVTGFLVDSASNTVFKSEFGVVRKHTGASGTAEDTSFYTTVSTAFSGGVYRAKLLSSGKYLFGGNFTTYKGASRARMVLLNSNYSEDTAFYTNLGTGFTGGIVYDFAELSSGKIVVVGTFTTFNGNTRNRCLMLNADGTEDTTFYTNLGTGFASSCFGVAVDSNDRIYVCGDYTSFNGNTRNRLVRLNSNGTEDTAFYTNLGSGFGAAVNTYRAAVQSNGKIIVVGSFTTLNGNTRGRIVRLNSDGTEDTVFATNIVGGATSASAALYEVVIQDDGSILIGGSFTAFGGYSVNRMVKVDSTGVPDATFITNLGAGFGTTDVRGITVQADGKINVGGTFTTFNGNTRNRIVRLNSDGTEDTVFYTTLVTSTGFNNGVYGFIYETNYGVIAYGIYGTFDGAVRNNVLRYYGDGKVEIKSQGILYGIYRDSTTSWHLLNQSYIGDNHQLTFSMTAGGQLQYTSTDLPGTLSVSEMKYVLYKL